jgi:hypothetical protein
MKGVVVKGDARRKGRWTILMVDGFIIWLLLAAQTAVEKYDIKMAMR